MSFIKKRLVFEKYSYDKEILYKIEIYKVDKKLNDDTAFWKAVLLMLALIALIVIFIGSLFLLKWKRPGLYLEDCIHRSCASGLGLKCIKSNCQCPTSEFYYTKECLPKKPHGEYCHDSQDQCKKGLVCLNGKCSCNRTQFWTSRNCSNRGSFAENCDSIQCLDSLFLTCDASSKTCLCDSTRFWSGEACYKKRLLNEVCDSSTIPCRTDLICNNGTCE
jgi:hypothetical protein